MFARIVYVTLGDIMNSMVFLTFGIVLCRIIMSPKGPKRSD